MKKIIACAAFQLMGSLAMAQEKNVGSYQEQYRPQFHFSPAKNWTNDPNGLVYYKGSYHLFYQHNPYGNTWGHMSWGHATSSDLVHWKHWPVAIAEDSGSMIFSGSCVIDETNTSGFAKKSSQTPMVAIYTSHHQGPKNNPDDYLQTQHLAYSLDDGATWTKYARNPVLDVHKKDFRDPFVFWYEREKKWVMTVVLPREHLVQFYSSKNLKDWKHMSDFGPAGDTAGIWECPSIAPVPVNHEPGKVKWVLFTSEQIVMQYFVGEFNGTTFINQNPAQTILRPDNGPDYYAAVLFNHLPAHHAPVLLGWVNNWEYANDIPTSPWKGAMSIPRQLSLEKINGAWVLQQKPVAALQSLRKKPWEKTNLSVAGQKMLPVSGTQMEIQLNWAPRENTISGIHFFAGGSNSFAIGYDAEKQTLFIDRKGSGDTAFNKKFGLLNHYEASLVRPQKRLSLDVFVDNSIIEIFAEDGTCLLTAQVFPTIKNTTLELFSNNGENLFIDAKVWQMASAW